MKIYTTIKKYTIDLIVYGIMFLLAIFRFQVAYSTAIEFDNAKTLLYDADFFIKNAMQYYKYNYTEIYALIKNRSYMWVLMLFHKLKISPQIGIALFWVISAVLIYILSKEFIKNRFVSLLLYTFTLFHPIAFFGMGAVVIYRNTIYVQMIIIYISLLFIIFSRIIKNKNQIINLILSIILGVVFVVQYFLTETGILHILIFLAFIALFYLYIFIKNKKLIKKSLVLFTSVLIFVFSYFGYKYVNFRAYGVSDINMRTEGTIGEFIHNVQSVKSYSQDSYIWSSTDQLEKVYKVSPTFKEHKDIYESIKSGWGSAAYAPNRGFAGDFMGWAIINSLVRYNIDYIEAKRIFKSINEEIKLAFDAGVLEKTNKLLLTNSLPRFTIEELGNTFNLCSDILNHLISLDNMNKMVYIFKPSEDLNYKYFSYFNVKIDDQYVSYFDFVQEILLYYPVMQFIIICFFVIATLMFIVYNVSFIKKYFDKIIDKYDFINNINVTFILMCGFIALFILYTYAMSLFLIWMAEHYKNDYEYIVGLYYNYSMGSYAFFILASVFAFATISKIIKKVEVERKIISDLDSNVYKYFAPMVTKKSYDLYGNAYISDNEKNKARLLYTFLKDAICIIFSIVAIIFSYKIISTTRLYEKIEYVQMQENFKKKQKKEKYEYIDVFFGENYNLKFNNNSIKEIIDNKSSIIENATVVGDKRADGLREYMGSNLNYNNKSYIGHLDNIVDNIDFYRDALTANKPILFYSIGIDDYINQTDLLQFKQKNDELFYFANLNNKIIVLHSYIDYDTSNKRIKKDYNDFKKRENKIEDYDYILKRLSKFYDNVIYIDMNDINNDIYIDDGEVYLNHSFYNVFLSRAIDKLKKYLNIK